MKIAVVHHWFVTRGGGERVAECIAALFPRAEIFTLVSSAAGLPASIAQRPPRTSFLQRLPGARTHHRHFLPLYPAAARSLNLSGFDLVLSSDSGPVKAVQLRTGAQHICYCHSPMRYLWDGYETYRDGMSGVTRLAFQAFAGYVRRSDAKAAARVDFFLANSRYVADRIRRCYGRESEVVHPPIDLHLAAAVAQERPGEHYLCAGRLVAYKRTELLMEACRLAGRPLRIAGAGPELERLKKLAAASPADAPCDVQFLGELTTEALWREYARCRALLFAADEDFGMVPLEAQACGRPVIAYGAGGSLETVRGNGAEATGAYFAAQTAEAAAEAIVRWEATGEPAFVPSTARRWAATFDTRVFLERYRAFVLEKAPAAAAEAASVEQAYATVTQADARADSAATMAGAR